jgi:Flp pilus assembly protein TadD
MNQHLHRAILLVQQSRHELAETELRQALALDPDEAQAHAWLALCLAKREAFADATTEAQQAIHLAPDFPFAYYALAHIYYARNRSVEARAAIQEAIRLDSSDADHFSLLAGIEVQEKHWSAALAAAEQGLELDPSHVGCTNFRAIALVKMGRRAEAGATIDAALAKNPENSTTHANQGWTCLESGNPQKALEHFKEALRLDPDNEWARQGIVEALKARNIIYAVMLKYFLWMSRFGAGKQWMILLGAFFGNRILYSLSKSNPALAPWLMPLRILYLAFAVLTWTADPLFNLVLRTNRFGRLALSAEQITASNWFGTCLLIALTSLVACLFLSFNSPWSVSALVFGLLLLPVSSIFKCATGWPRRIAAGYTIGLALIGIALVGLVVVAESQPVATGKETMSNFGPLFSIFIIGFVISTWGANLLLVIRRRR